LENSEISAEPPASSFPSTQNSKLIVEARTMGPGPMVLRGLVTKVGVMDKTATVTVWRTAIHKRTQKVSRQFFLVDVVLNFVAASPFIEEIPYTRSS
jgi:hypothetical protein